MVAISFVITCIGSVLVLHSAYSCLHFRSLVEDESLVPPIDVLIEVLLGFLLCLIGSLVYIGPLLPIHTKSDTKSVELVAPPYRSRDFDMYSTRLKVLAGLEKKISS